MTSTNTSILFVFSLAIGQVVAFAGSSQAGDEKTNRSSVQIARSDDAIGISKSAVDATITGKLTLPLLNPNPTLPTVILSDGHKKTCLKQVGDKVGDVTVSDVKGEKVNLNDTLSDELTVLIFWSEKSVAGYEQFRRIPVDVLGTFAPYRVKVVAVNVGGTLAETKRLTGNAGDKIVSLVDSDSKLFKQFATDYVPRTYVIDKDGAIVWFDLEHSESSRRSLNNALTYFLQQSKLKSK